MCWNDLSKYRSQIYGISIMWIVIFHIYEAFNSKLSFTSISSLIFNNGNLGVDIFLFLSGISMYYSMRKYKKLNLSNIMDFYKRRFKKILKVYILFCIPFLILRDIIMQNNMHKFVRQVLFFDQRVSSFWFLMAIMICYFIYPGLRLLLLKGKEKIIVGIIVIYIVMLFFLNHYYKEFYELYEILLSRIPIFIIGSLFAKQVEGCKKVSIAEFSFFMLIILVKTPVLLAMSGKAIIGEIMPVLNRLSMGWMGIGIIFIMILFTKVYEGSAIDRCIGWIGSFTLEIYVFHIAFRKILLYIMQSVGIMFDSYWQIILFGIIFIPFSVVGGYILFLITNRYQKFVINLKKHV